MGWHLFCCVASRPSHQAALVPDHIPKAARRESPNGARVGSIGSVRPVRGSLPPTPFPRTGNAITPSLFAQTAKVISKACLRAVSADLDGQDSWSTWLNLGWESLTRFMGRISNHQGDISSRMSLRDGTRPNAWINSPPSRRAQSI